jgi:hypothetical protein
MAKLSILFVICAFLSQESHAQGTFPLQEGNLWQFVCNDPASVNPEIRITGDTTLPNGKMYMIYDSNFWGILFVRQEGAIVYAYNDSDSSDYGLFNFTMAPNDTVSTRDQFGFHFVITVLDSGRISPASQFWSELQGKKYWIFADNMCVDISFSYEFSRWIVVDSVGVVEMVAEPGFEWFLTGALIDGVIKFGVINSVPPPLSTIPHGFVLFQNYPNPFNPSTSISFHISELSYVNLTVFDILGREVVTLVNDLKRPGDYTAKWTAERCASGTYFCRLQIAGVNNTASFTSIRKMVLVK